jgi:hypothetical protein
MKLSGTNRVIVEALIFVVAAGVLSMLYAGQVNEQGQLMANLSNGSPVVPRLVAERDRLQEDLARLEEQTAQRRKELTEAGALLTRAKTDWPDSVESLEYSKKLADIAAATNVDVIRLATSEVTSKEVQGFTFWLTAFTVEVRSRQEGVRELVAFVDAVHKHASFATATIDTLMVTVPPPPAEGQAADPPTASIALTVYAFKGE